MRPMNSGNLEVTAPNDTDIVMTRVFDAPKKLVYEAFTKPALVRRWLGVQNGWTMETCEIELAVGGSYRYVWQGPGREAMGMTGTFLEIVPNERLVSKEKFDDPWYEGEAIGTTAFSEAGGKTTVTMTVRYDTKAIRDAVLRSPMEHGVAASFDLLARQLAS